jgi:hypothetical protein
MLQEVQGVTASAASGINDEYASFRDLMEAYASAERRGTAEDLLANCQIRTSKNGTASDRKLGRVRTLVHLLLTLRFSPSVSFTSCVVMTRSS